jgi:phage tail-like protein
MTVRTISSDGLRNFKFIVTMNPPANSQVPTTIGRLGFMTVDGFAMQTEVIPYREGGDNTTTRKMPGQTDYGPITFGRGSMAGPPGAGSGGSTGTDEFFLWTGLIFAAMEGSGTGTTSGDFRTDIMVDVLQHPVTSGPNAAGSYSSSWPTKLRFHIYNAWVMALSYSGLDAGGNGVLIESCQIAHEGFKPIYGNIAATGPNSSGYVPTSAV